MFEKLLGVSVYVLAATSYTRAVAPPFSSPSHIRIFPLGRSVMLIATIGMEITPVHWPTSAGSVTVLDVLTVRRDETLELPERSVARAESLCVPLAARAVFRVVEKG